MVGSGPAGLACAQQLARAGHAVVVFEKNDRIGGLLRYGIPDFKMEKWLIDRRIEQMRAEGVEFRVNHVVGAAPVGAGNRQARPVDPKKLLAEFDAVVLAGGAEQPRDLPVPGRELDGVHFAMDFLPLQNRRVAGDTNVEDLLATRQARGRHRRRRHRLGLRRHVEPPRRRVGHAVRAAAAAARRRTSNPVWPYWPMRLRTSSSHEEGASATGRSRTKRFEGEGGKVEKLIAARSSGRDGKPDAEVPGSEFEMKADLVLLAMGFVSPVQAVLERFGVAEGRARQRQGGDRRRGSYRTSRAEGVRRRRHAPRPVARGLGDPRRPPVRPRGRRVPDGQLRAAALASSRTFSQSFGNRLSFPARSFSRQP